MKKISSAIVTKLIRAGELDEEVREEYEYAIQNVLLSFGPIAILLVCGLIMHQIVDCILIILPFFLLRKFSGGFHFRNVKTCLISSSVLLIFMLVLSNYIEAGIILELIVLLSDIGLCALSPLDSDERRMDREEKIACKHVTIVMIVLFTILYGIMVYIGLYEYAICFAEGLIMTFGLLALGYIKQMICKKGGQTT